MAGFEARKDTASTGGFRGHLGTIHDDTPE